MLLLRQPLSLERRPYPADIGPFYAPLRMVYAYDPTSDSNLTLDGSNNIEQMNDMTGEGRHATQSNASLRPARVTGASGINSVNVASFVASDGDTMTVGSATTAFARVAAIGGDGVILVPTLSGNQVVARVFTSTVNAQMWNLQVLDTSGLLRLATRRIGGDSVRNITSTLALKAGVASFVSVEVDYYNFTFRFKVDDDEELITPAVAWASGRGYTDKDTASASPTVASSGNLITAKIGSWRMWTGHMPSGTVNTRWLAQQAIFSTPLRKVAFASLATIRQNRAYKEIAGIRDNIPVAGTVTRGADANIYVRFLDALDVINNDPSPTVGVALTNIGPSVSLAWSAEIDAVPIGHWYATARKDGDGDEDEVIDRTNIISVTKAYFHLGQSPERKIGGRDGRWATSGGGVGNNVGVSVPLPGAGTDLFGRRFSRRGYFDTTETRDGAFNAGATGEPYETDEPQGGPTGQDVGGNGLAVFQSLYYDRRGYAPLMVFRPIGGTPVYDWVKAGAIRVDTGANWTAMQNAVTQAYAPQWEMHGAFYSGGEDEANDADLANLGITNSRFKDCLRAVIAQLRTESGDANLKVWISILVRTTAAYSDDSADDVIDAQLEMIDSDANVYMSDNPRDLDSEDSQHIVRTGYANFRMPRREQNVARAETPGSVANGATGPKVTSATLTAGENKATLNVTHDGGTTLLGSDGSTLTTARLSGGSASAAGLSQFGSYVWVNGTQRNLTAAYLSAGTIVLEFDGAALVSGDVFGFKHQRGKAPDNTMVVHDDSAHAVPLQPSRGTRGLQTYTTP